MAFTVNKLLIQTLHSLTIHSVHVQNRKHCRIWHLFIIPNLIQTLTLHSLILHSIHVQNRKHCRIWHLLIIPTTHLALGSPQDQV